MNIYIKTVQKPTRYLTSGDWYWMDDTLCIEVLDTQDPRSNFLIAVHEFVEAVLCMFGGVSEHEVTAFDVAYERSRLNSDDSEPGDHPAAPYHKQHGIATAIEHILCMFIGYDWQYHDHRINITVEASRGREVEIAPS